MPGFERRRGRFRISTDPADLDVDAIQRCLSQSYWGEGIPRAVVARSLAGSLCFGLYEADLQIGLARAITDRATHAYLCDVYVLKEYRGRGLWFTPLARPDRHMEIARPGMYRGGGGNRD